VIYDEKLAKKNFFAGTFWEVKMKRKRMSAGKDRRVFSRTAMKVKGKNLRAVPMRGGFRI
jgi:hypothetical protein